MSDNDREQRAQPNAYASPPCYQHELDPAFVDLESASPPLDVARWRSDERQRLAEARLAIDHATRRHWDQRIVAYLSELLTARQFRVVGAYWPLRGEPDIRPLLPALGGRGIVCALPAVVCRGQPLDFRRFAPGDLLDNGPLNTRMPLQSAPCLAPEVILAPLIGYDQNCHRLGHGGGYYDRTLATQDPPAMAIGVGYGLSALETIYPQKHDIPMDVIVTEAGIRARR